MSALPQRFDATLSRLDSVLDAQVARLERVEAQQAAEREEARRVRMRDNMYARTQIAARYADAYRSFGSEPPAPADDEPPSQYRARLYNRLARRLPPDHKLASVRADDISAQPVVLDRFEEMLIDAAKAEGARPSQENLPSDGAMISRARVDADSGSKITEFFGRESFIKSMGREGRKVARIIDPRSRTVIWGRPLDRV